jgi:5-methylcytosine-specific restriction endonuclease McrA
VFVAGKVRAARGVKPQLLAQLAEDQQSRAIPVLDTNARRYWWCKGRFFWEDDDLSAEDVFALVYERQVRAERKLERARTTVAIGEVPSIRREGISRELRLAVFERDGGQCVECSATFELQFDHVIPVAMGGGSTLENLQILCGDCNRRKGASL